MNQFSATLFLLVFVMLIACKTEKPLQPEVPQGPPALDLPEELNTNVLVPLTVGNWWKYETGTYNPGSDEPVLRDSSMWRIHADTLLTHEGRSFTAAIAGWY